MKIANVEQLKTNPVGRCVYEHEIYKYEVKEDHLLLTNSFKRILLPQNAVVYSNITTIKWF